MLIMSCDRRCSGFLKRTVKYLVAVMVIVSLPISTSGVIPVPGVKTASADPPFTTGVCTSNVCRFQLFVNPGLGAGKPFACPAIQNATGTIQVLNRFATGQQNDIMLVSASGLPPNTAFDLFLVENSPIDFASGFPGFGFAWYQSDLQSDSQGNASVQVRGIFDVETFIQPPFAPNTAPPSPVHTYNVGFWFNSPQEEASVCPSAVPSPQPFNGEQNSGLLAMITSGGPLQNVQP